MAGVCLKQVSKRFPDGTIAVDDINLDVAAGELMVLVGPSGCGKSTTLRLIAGLETPTQGDIQVGSRSVTDLAAAKRDIAMVFQNYALYPHMTVYGNLSFGLRLQNRQGVFHRVVLGGKRRSSKEASGGETMSQRVQRVARDLGIEPLLNRRPHQLSGGERQRVALGRAVVRNPAAFLFDEPLSNLDAKLRVEMRGQLKRLHEQLGTTMIYVTHDQVEAMTLGDRIAVMNHGKIQQLDTPKDIYRAPANRFVAEFMGTVPMNLIAGRLVDKAEGPRFVGGSLIINLDRARDRDPNIDDNLGSPVVLGIRGEEIKLTEPSQAKQGSSPARVCQVDPLGDSQMITVELPPVKGNDGNVGERENWTTMTVRTEPAREYRRGQEVRLDWSECRWHWFDGTTGDRLNIES